MTDITETYARALAAWQAGDKTLCAALCSAVLASEPDDGPSHLLRAVALGGGPEGDEIALAAAHYASACRNAPHDADSWFNRGVFLEGLGRLAEAVDCYRRALAIAPVHIGALINGTQLIRIFEHFEEALVLADRIQRLLPDNPIGYTHAAISLQHLGRLEQADAVFEQAVKLAPDPAHLLWEQHFSLLARERFAEAWAGYEVRFSGSVANGVDDLPFSCPRWDGTAGQHVLVYGEQGLGDQLMFACALRDLIAIADKVTLAVSPALVALFAASFPEVAVLALVEGATPESCADIVVRAGETRPVDSVLAIGSLMTHFRRERASFEGTPYLRASDDARAWWQDNSRRISRSHLGDPKVRIGLCWASNPAPERFFSARRAVHKTMPLSLMAELATIESVDAVAVTNVPLHVFKPDPVARDMIADVSCDLIDLDRTAALLEGLDLLITVDTGVAHLAGALGVPVWVLLHAGGDARWGIRGTRTSYWYNCARLYWQHTPGDWQTLIACVADDLIRLAEATDREDAA